MIVHDVKQGEHAWLQCRAGVITASELDRIISPLGHIRMKDGEWSDGARTYICEKIAERWIGGPLEARNIGGSAEQGNMLEEEAVPWLAARWHVDLIPGKRRKADEHLPVIGFIETDDHSFGCSPDAMFPGLEIGVEVKCPEPTNFVKWMLAGGVPTEHMLQIQGYLQVTGASVWRFVSYRRNFPPPLIVEVFPDPALQDAIREAVRLCNASIAEGYAKLVEANGGKEPKRREPKPVPVLDPDPFGASAPDVPINMKSGHP